MSALVNKIYTLGNLVSFSNAGLTVASFVDIKKTLISRFKQLYGEDVDVSDASADGQYITEIALLINNVLQTLNTLYANLDPSVASGKALDILASFSNIYRKPATSSTCVVSIENDTDAAIQFPISLENTKFIDINGLAWSIDTNQSSYIPGYSPYIDEYTLTVNAHESISLALICDEVGPIDISPNTIEGFMQITQDTSMLTVLQSASGTIGSNEESDIHLRARRNSSAANEAVTVLDSIKGTLLANNNIVDALVISDIVNHCVYVYIRRKYENASATLDDVDNFIGETIYQKLTPGIPALYDSTSSSTQKTYEKTVDPVIASLNIKWADCNPLEPLLKIQLHRYANFDESASTASIQAVLTEYINNLNIGVDISAANLLQLIIAADPKYQGNATYYCTPSDISIKVGDAYVAFTGEIDSSMSAKAKKTYYSVTSNNITILSQNN